MKLRDVVEVVVASRLPPSPSKVEMKGHLLALMQDSMMQPAQWSQARHGRWRERLRPFNREL